MDNEIAKELANQTSSVLDRAYDDAVHPSAVSIGDTASLIPRTVGVLLGRWKVWVVNGEWNIDLAINQVAEKLEDVPEERLCEPAPNVVAPAIQQLSHSFDSEELRKLYVNLLATSMDRERRNGAHPSFVNLIGQMTPDEAKIMAWFAAGEGRDYIPIVDLRLVKTDEVIKYTWRPLLENCTNALDGIVELPGSVSPLPRQPGAPGAHTRRAVLDRREWRVPSPGAKREDPATKGDSHAGRGLVLRHHAQRLPPHSSW